MVSKREIWLTEEARGHLANIEESLPVKPLPSKIIEAALREMAGRVKRPRRATAKPDNAQGADGRTVAEGE